MCVYISTCIYVCMYLQTDIANAYTYYIHTRIHTHITIQRPTYTTYIHAYIHTLQYKGLHILHTCIHTYITIHRPIYTTYIHAYMNYVCAGGKIVNRLCNCKQVVPALTMQNSLYTCAYVCMCVYIYAHKCIQYMTLVCMYAYVCT